MSGISSAAPAIAMIAAFVLAVGGTKLALSCESRTRGMLMIAAAAVLLGNVLIWTI
ncbi:MAG: hypothetical protein ABIQ32_04165 [Sphingomicrobium sp.]